MFLQRKPIRDRVVELLKDNKIYLGVAEENILKNRIQQIGAETVTPIVVVYSLVENFGILSDSPIQDYRSTKQLAIDCILNAQTDLDLDDAIDELCNKVATVILLNYTDNVDGSRKWNWLELKSYDPTNYVKEGESNYVIGRLMFDVIYDTKVSPADLEQVAGINGEIEALNLNESVSFSSEDDLPTD